MYGSVHRTTESSLRTVPYILTVVRPTGRTVVHHDPYRIVSRLEFDANDVCSGLGILEQPLRETHRSDYNCGGSGGEHVVVR